MILFLNCCSRIIILTICYFFKLVWKVYFSAQQCLLFFGMLRFNQWFSCCQVSSVIYHITHQNERSTWQINITKILVLFYFIIIFLSNFDDCSVRIMDCSLSLPGGGLARFMTKQQIKTVFTPFPKNTKSLPPTLCPKPNILAPIYAVGND